MDIDRGKIRLGIECDRRIPIYRSELMAAAVGGIQQQAAANSLTKPEGVA